MQNNTKTIEMYTEELYRNADFRKVNLRKLGVAKKKFDAIAINHPEMYSMSRTTESIMQFIIAGNSLSNERENIEGTQFTTGCKQVRNLFRNVVFYMTTDKRRQTWKSCPEVKKALFHYREMLSEFRKAWEITLYDNMLKYFNSIEHKGIMSEARMKEFLRGAAARLCIKTTKTNKSIEFIIDRLAEGYLTTNMFEALVEETYKRI